MKDIKVDFVYLWVDGADPVWHNKKKAFLPKDVIKDAGKEATSECRYIDNNELKYSLRSLEMYAPWINKIFIVTDGQVPSWLNVDNPKIKIVDHKEIIEDDYLPLFNSTAIEMRIDRIPGLSEHFIFGNDDMMFAKETTPDFFFTEEGLPIVRHMKKSFRCYKRSNHRNYSNMVYSSILKIREEYGQAFEVAPHHCADAYTKTLYRKCIEKYSEWASHTMNSRFRMFGDMHRSIIGLYGICEGLAVERKVNRTNNIGSLKSLYKAFVLNEFNYDSKRTQVGSTSYEEFFKRYNPYLVCFNDNEDASEEDREELRDFLKRSYSVKSSFEK